MEKLSMCRICLVENVRMCVVTNKSLQETYEKLADVPFVTEDRKPMLACLFCCTRLKQCCQLQRQCVQAEELLAQMLSEDYEQKPLTDRGHLEFVGGFIITPIEHISIVDDCQIVSDAIKQEPPDVCEEQGDVELQSAQPSDELDAENIYSSHLDVEAHHSKFESEEEQLLVVIKIEGEEEKELPEKLRVGETENAAASKEQTPKRKLEDSIPAKQKMKTGRKCVNSLEDQKKALLRYKNLFENNRIPPPSDPVYALVQSALPKPITLKGIYVSVKKNFKYFFDVPNIIEDNSIQDSREAAIVKKPIKRDQEDTLPAKQTMNVPSDSKIIRTTETSTSESVAKIKEPITTSSQSSFSQSSNLIQHNDVKTFICDVCHGVYSSKKSLKVHLRIHTGEKPYKCDICQRSFHMKCILKAHMQMHTGEKPYKCQLCQKSFNYNSNLANHVCKHSGEKPFKCDVCQRSFRLKGYLALHFRQHSDEKPFKCDICQWSFSCKSRLIRHVSRHTGVKPFKCDVCQRSFKEKGYLNIHYRIHTGESKTVKCDICQSCFRDKEHLKRHSVVHTGVKAFDCDICQCSFTAKSSLTVHKSRKHSGERRFKCDVCQRRFCVVGSLNRHRRVHTGEKPFKCHLCQDSFSSKRNLEVHFKRHSGEDPLK